MLQCSNLAYYTGWTTDIFRRVKQHQSGRGANYTKMNAPVVLVYWETHQSNQIARKREIAIKKMTHQMKNNIAQGKNHLEFNMQYFSNYEYFVSSPGRVNLLGEHVDYNGGPVLPVAIDRSVSLWANKQNDELFCIKTIDLNLEVIFSLESLEKKVDIHGDQLSGWALYPASVIWAAVKNQLTVKGFDAIFSSNVPIGAGLSSSAAVEIAFAALLREICDWRVDDTQLALLCQTAENDYVGVNCGIMDQFASANGVYNAALYLNTSTLKWYPVQLPDNVVLIIADSKIRRSLASSAYNERRESCEEAFKILRQNLPKINYLADIHPDQFQNYGKSLSEVTYKRSKHVIDECHRVEQAVDFLKNGDISSFGRLMCEGHESLRDLYEVSIPEIDILVDLANQSPDCFGSRLTGAGFGGCTVSIVKKDKSEDFIQYLHENYKHLTGKEIDVYLCTARTGVFVEWRKISRSQN